MKLKHVTGYMFHQLLSVTWTEALYYCTILKSAQYDKLTNY